MDDMRVATGRTGGIVSYGILLIDGIVIDVASIVAYACYIATHPASIILILCFLAIPTALMIMGSVSGIKDAILYGEPSLIDFFIAAAGVALEFIICVLVMRG